MPVPAAELRGIDLFDELGDERLEAWAAAAEPLTLAVGDTLTQEGSSPRGLVLLVEGIMETTHRVEDRAEPIARHRAPTWVGGIAALAGSESRGETRAETVCRVGLIPTPKFVDLVLADRPVFHRIMSQIRPVMTRMSAVEANRERLASLGTMAAGLAHELNNPAAAAKRAAAQLVDALDVISGALAQFVEAGVEREQAALLLDLQRKAMESAAGRTPLDALDAADAEDEMLDRLEAMGVPGAWELAGALAEAGVDEAWLTEFTGVAGQASAAALRWVVATLSAHGLAAELQESASRMSNLVGAVKSYAYMDRGEVVAIDLHEGLETTLVVLGHKLRDASVEVRRAYDRTLPSLMVHGSELNQVWTNIIDNAIDAMAPGGGTLLITTSRQNGCAQVDFADSGSGIPEADRPHVFDPFYTTKPVGRGTGLGLDTSRRIIELRHRGSLWFDSGPSGTTFHVRLPLEGPSQPAQE